MTFSPEKVTADQQEKLNSMVKKIQSGKISSSSGLINAISKLFSTTTFIAGEGVKGPTGPKHPDGSGGSAQD